eukprot:3758741-Amphidinium_carterae.1
MALDLKTFVSVCSRCSNDAASADVGGASGASGERTEGPAVHGKAERSRERERFQPPYSPP